MKVVSTGAMPVTRRMSETRAMSSFFGHKRECGESEENKNRFGINVHNFTEVLQRESGGCCFLLYFIILPISFCPFAGSVSAGLLLSLHDFTKKILLMHYKKS